MAMASNEMRKRVTIKTEDVKKEHPKTVRGLSKANLKGLGPHYLNDEAAQRIRAQYELRVTRSRGTAFVSLAGSVIYVHKLNMLVSIWTAHVESAVGVPSALLAGSALDMLVELKITPNTVYPHTLKVEAILLGAVVIINLMVTLISGLIYWAGMRIFCATTKRDTVMIDAFEGFWHDKHIKAMRALSRSLFFVSPFLFVMAIIIHVFEHMGLQVAVVVSIGAVLLFYPLWKITQLICEKVGHHFTVNPFKAL